MPAPGKKTAAAAPAAPAAASAAGNAAPPSGDIIVSNFVPLKLNKLC
jgi:hypothetical protein